jgi:hypothetical protein
MESITNWSRLAYESLSTLSQKIMTELPNVLGALFLIIIGWFIARILSFVVRKALKVIQFDKLIEKINVDAILEKAHITIKPSDIIGKFVYWVILLLFLVTASDTLGWNVVSQSIHDLIAYLPKLFSAIVIFVLGLYIANFVRTGLKGLFDSLSITSGNMISTFAFYLIAIIITLTALSQAGVDTTIITSNVTLIVGGIVLAFAISFGFGSRNVLTNILSSYYVKQNFEVNQVIEIADLKGKIIKINNISCIVETTSGHVVIPVNKLLSENVKIVQQ